LPPGRGRLGHEEGVARGLGVEIGGIDPVRLGELADGPRAERRQPEPERIGRRFEVSEHDPQRVRGPELVVAVRHEHERGQALDPPAEQPQEIEGRLVRPVQILEHEHSGLYPELVEERADHLVRPRASFHQATQLAAGRLGDVCERPERAGREQRVTGSLQHANVAWQNGEQHLYQCGLPTACLRGHEHEAPAAPPGLREGGTEGFELGIPLEQRGGCNSAHP
jgi:hypothetical protein